MSGNRKILIIGNGPSARELAEAGLDNLPADVDTFGMGVAYRYFREVGWWPDYYALGDSKVVFSHRQALGQVVEDPAVTTKRFFFSWPVSEHPRFELIGHSSTGDFCFRKAVELGYREIFLIGIEGEYVEEIVESRPLDEDEFHALGFDELGLSDAHRRTLRIIAKTPEHNPNYFFDSYQQAGDVYSLPQSARHRDRWTAAAEIVAEVAAGAAGSSPINVLNLSARSRILDFPKATLASFLDPTAAPDYCYGPFERDAGKRIEEAHMVRDVLDVQGSGASAAPGTRLMVDVGACKGGAFRDFARAGWTVHAFEPNPPLFEQLVEKYAAPNVVLNNAALSDVEGDEIPFYTSDESIGISSLKPFRESHRETARVTTTTLDSYLSAQHIEHIDFLKIDTEGFDLMVLKGLDLERRPADVILCEFEDLKTRPLGYSTVDLADYLVAAGYTVYVSEWHPVIRYGGPHQWRALKSYPCELEDDKAWGNLLAFRADPGICALSKAAHSSAADFEDWEQGADEAAAEGAPPAAGREAGATAGNGASVARAEADRADAASAAARAAAAEEASAAGTPRRPGSDINLKKLKAARRRIRDLEQQLADMHASTSWRITAPLRKLSRMLRGNH